MLADYLVGVAGASLYAEKNHGRDSYFAAKPGCIRQISDNQVQSIAFIRRATAIVPASVCREMQR